jgi:hypothetical protein
LINLPEPSDEGFSITISVVTSPLKTGTSS